MQVWIHTIELGIVFQHLLAQSKYDIPLRLEYSYLLQSVAIIDDYGRFAPVQIVVIFSHSNAT